LGPLSDKLINGATKPAPPPAPAPAPPPATTAAAPAAEAPAAAPAEAIDVDGIRLRVIHYCVDNGIAFKLYRIKLYRIGPDGARIIEADRPASPSAVVHVSGQGRNLLDTKLVDDFPHPPTDPAARRP